MMRTYLKLDFERIFHSKRFMLALLTGIVICILQVVIDGNFRVKVLPVIWNPFATNPEKFETGVISMLYPNTWQENWIGGTYYGLFPYLFLILIPLLISLSWGDSLTFDLNSGYVKNLLIRGNKKQYYSARLISSFLIGGLVILLPLIMNMLMWMSVLPGIKSSPASGFAIITADQLGSELYFSNPVLYTVTYLTGTFIFCGLISVLTVMAGAYTSNRFVPLILPEIIYLFVRLICTSANKLSADPFSFLMPAQWAPLDIRIVLIEGGILFLLGLFLFQHSIKRDVL